MLFIRLFYYYSFLWLALAADHNVFKDCSRVEFCTRLRHATPSSTYIPDPYTFQLDGKATVHIQMAKPDEPEKKMLLSIKNYEAAFRITIKEINSSRYELDAVLKEDLELVPIDSFVLTNESLTLQRGNNWLVLKYDPIFMEIYYNDIVHTIVNTDLLIFEDTSQSFKFGVTFPEALRLYGIHEHADHLALQDTIANNIDPYRLKSLDVAGYELNSPMALYGAIPVLYGHGLKTTSGIFLHNAAEQWYDLQLGIYSERGASASILVESGTFDLFILAGPRPRDVVGQYQKLTGVAPMPEFWALGYHQSRWNYDNQSDVKNVIANFDKYNFPVDSIWLDIEYADGKRYFTWDPVAFSDPIEMQRNISANGRKLVAIIDPHIKVDDDYFVYKGAKDGDYLLKNKDGSNFEDQCWPGLSSYYDFLNPNAAKYYSSLYSYENFKGSTSTLAGIWNDMNEPSVFDDSLEKTLPGELVHYGGINHKDVHNIYGFLQSRYTYQGLMDRDNGTKRPFVLSRAHFAGSQRYASIWTGDNTADWGYLAVSYSECLNANILGISFCGADVGGFDQNPGDELLQRWYQAGAWLPFYRAHSHSGTKRREPYLYPNDIQQVFRDALNQRYKHLLYWYKLFFEHEMVNGDPLIRPLFYEYPEDAKVIDMDDQILVGRDILVHPIAEPGVTSVNVYFPGEANDFWISALDFQTYQAGGEISVSVNMSFIPVFYRSGSIVTVYNDVYPKSTQDLNHANVTFYSFYDADNHCEGTFYYDDFTSFKYRDGDYTYIKLAMNKNSVTITNLNPASRNEELKIGEIIRFRRNSAGETIVTNHLETADGQALSSLKFDNQKTITFNLSQ